MLAPRCRCGSRRTERKWKGRGELERTSVRRILPGSLRRTLVGPSFTSRRAINSRAGCFFFPQHKMEKPPYLGLMAWL